MRRQFFSGAVGLAFLLGASGCSTLKKEPKVFLEDSSRYSLMEHVPDYNIVAEPVNCDKYVIHIKQAHWIDPALDGWTFEYVNALRRYGLTEEISKQRDFYNSMYEEVVRSQTEIKSILEGFCEKGITNVFQEGYYKPFTKESAEYDAKYILNNAIDYGIILESEENNFRLLPGAAIVMSYEGKIAIIPPESETLIDDCYVAMDEFGFDSSEYIDLEEVREDYIFDFVANYGFDNSILVLGGLHNLVNNSHEFRKTYGWSPGIIEIDCSD